MDLDSFIQKVKEKKELRGVADEFIKTLIVKELKHTQEPRSEKDERILLKTIRSSLRMHTGRFHAANTLADNHDTPTVLHAHASTRERREHYAFLRELVAKFKPRSILDVGCGLNPLLLATPHETYYACDINVDEIERINAHFKRQGIPGRAFVADVRTYDAFPSADLCLMLKLLDLVDTKGRKNAESLILRVPCKNMIISFPTKKLSGKRMNRPNRVWMEKLLDRHNYFFTKASTDNELFYLITKP